MWVLIFKIDIRVVVAIKKFSIVLTHYNQMKYIYEALDSLFMQDYGRIQLIVTDDYSKEFDESKIIEYIEKNKKTNIENYKIIKNSKNIGTVKTLNNALRYVEGDYVLFYAADDKLFDLNTISRFVNEFENSDEMNIITSQAYMCKDNLIVNKDSIKFVNTKKAFKYNKMSPKEQYYYLASDCLFVSGATAYRKAVFEKIGGFDESFKLAEDWSFWLELNMNGEKIRYVDFISLLHRTGGISHIEAGEIPEHVKRFYLDDLRVYTKLIIPNFNEFPNNLRNIIMDKYMWYLDYYDKIIPNTKDNNIQYTNLAYENSHYKRYLKIKKIKQKKIKMKNNILKFNSKYNFFCIITKYLLFILLCIIIFSVKKYDFSILIYISLAYFFSLFINKIIKTIYWRRKNDRRKNI